MGMDFNWDHRPQETHSCRDLFERRYPYLSGGARTGLGTRQHRAGLLERASRSDRAVTPVGPPPAFELEDASRATVSTRPRCRSRPSWRQRATTVSGDARRVASRAVARILIVGGGCRGRALAVRLVQEGRHAVRITTRTESGRAAIETTGAECLIGTPDRLASMRGALDGVTIACWMLVTAQGDPEQVQALHSSRVESFLSGAIDTTMRGFIYEAATSRGSAHDPVLAGERIVRTIAERNAIPITTLQTDIADSAAWQKEALAAIDGLLEGRDDRTDTLS